MGTALLNNETAIVQPVRGHVDFYHASNEQASVQAEQDVARAIPTDPVSLLALFVIVASAVAIALLLVPSFLRWRDARRRRPLYTQEEVDAMLEAADGNGFRRASRHFDHILSGLEQLEGLPRGERVADHEKGRLAS